MPGRARAPAVLVSDVVMPGRSGIELAETLLHRDPGLCVVLMSGYARHHDLAQLPAHVRLLPKPFVAEELVRVVLGTLDGQRDQ